ncbi:MAG: endonuclease domain-containing protein [Alphaproteobacteria bacterium]
MSIKRARELQKAMTPQEVALWFRLRDLKSSGFHFRRQSPEAGYILDFVCRSANLVVEIDGVAHSDARKAEYDAQRDTALAGRGFKTLRFSASDVEREIDGVLSTILHALGQRRPTRRAVRDILPETGRDEGAPAPRAGSRYNNLVRLGLRMSSRGDPK